MSLLSLMGLKRARGRSPRRLLISAASIWAHRVSALLESDLKCAHPVQTATVGIRNQRKVARCGQGVTQSQYAGKQVVQTVGAVARAQRKTWGVAFGDPTQVHAGEAVGLLLSN